MAHVYTLQHVEIETPGTLALALERAGVTLRRIRSFAGEPVPQTMEGADGLIVMGGPMGVYERDQYPFLNDEVRLLESALRQEKPVLGVCLGSQLLATALGATVAKGARKEIGWHPVTLTEAARDDALWRDQPATFTGFHWHGDVFALPAGAAPLATSALTPLQAFRYGVNAYGVLFHPEVTAALIAGMTAAFADELRDEGLDGDAIQRQAQTYLAPLQRIGAVIFGRWAALLPGARER